MFWFWYFKGLNMKLDPHILWRCSWERQKLFWVHLVRSHSLWRAKLMSLGRQDWDPALSWISCSPQENPWAPLWLSSPRWENTLEQAGRMEQGRAWSQQVQQSSPGLTGASHKFCSAAKSLGGKEAVLVSCDGKPAQEFALRRLKVVSVQLNVSFSFQSQVLQLFSPSAGYWALLKAAKTYKIRFHLRRKRDFFLSSTKGPSLRFGSHPSVWSQSPKTSRGIIWAQTETTNFILHLGVLSAAQGEHVLK